MFNKKNMTKNIFFFCLLLVSNISNGMLKQKQLELIEQQTDAQKNDDKIIVNNYIQLTANPNMQNNAESTPISYNNASNRNLSQNNLENENAATSNAHAESNPTITIEQNQSWHSDITDFFAHNKKRLFLYTLIITYATLYYYVEQGNHYLQNPLLWSGWHKELSLNNLQNIPHEQLMRELLTTIQQQYVYIENPIDFVMPLSIFLQEIAQEEKQLRFYRKLYFTCSRMKIKRFLPFTQAYRKIGARLRRINFLRTNFVIWVTQYNMNHNYIN